MPNFLRRPLKSSRNNRNGPGRYDGQGRGRNSAGSAPRIGPMLDDRRVDPSIQSDPSRIGPMDNGGRNGSSYGDRAGSAQGDRERDRYSSERREPTSYLVRRRPTGGDRDR